MHISRRSNGVYYVWFIDEAGRRKKVSSGSKLKSEALKFMREFNLQERDKKARQLNLLLSEFKVDYLSYSRSRHTPKTQEGIELAFNQLLKFLGDVYLKSITIRQVEAFLSMKIAEASLWSARKYYITLRAAFETARRWNCLEVNVFGAVEKPKPPEVQPAFFTRDEFRTLLDSINERDWAELFIAAVSTGMRLSELTALRWSDVDFVQRALHVRNSETFTTKSKKNRVIPMTDQLSAILSQKKLDANFEFVFHRNGRRLTKDEVSKAFKRYVIKAKVNRRLHFHSCRHTFASWLVQSGVSLYEVQKLLGHSTSKVTEIYSHLQPGLLHNTVSRIDLRLN